MPLSSCAFIKKDSLSPGDQKELPPGVGVGHSQESLVQVSVCMETHIPGAFRTEHTFGEEGAEQVRRKVFKYNI